MKHLILFSTLLGLAACRPNADVAPVPLPVEVVGTYQTNGFLDYRCLALPANQMPTVTIRATGLNTLTVTLTRFRPKTHIQTLTGVTLSPQPDQHMALLRGNQVIGSVQTSRVFTASGMETQGKLLRLSAMNTDFTGYLP